MRLRRLAFMRCLPAVVGLILLLLFARVAVPLGDSRVGDPDVFWLAAVGRDIARSHAMPHVNGYSFADGSYPWVMHEGIFALVDFAGLNALGPAFFALLGVVSGAAIVFFGLTWLFGQTRSALAGGIAGVALLSCERLYFSPRPAFVALFFVVAMIAAVMRPGWSKVRAALAIVLELVWTNSHGSFPLGVVLIVAGAFDAARPPLERRAWLRTAALAFAVTFVNPYGLKLYGLVDRYLRGADPTARVIQTHILGFASLWDGLFTSFVNPESLVALVLLAALSIRAIVRRKQVARAVVVLSGVLLAIYQVRNVALAVVLGVLLLHEAADEVTAPMHSKPEAPRWMAAAIVAPGLLIGCVRWASAWTTRPALSWLAPSLGGAPFVRLSHGLPDGARLFAPFRPSSLVLWFESERGVKVLYDPRNDCYSPEVALGALELDRQHPDDDNQGPTAARPVADFLEKYGTDFAIVLPGGVATALRDDAAWVTWGRDGDWVAFHRK